MDNTPAVTMDASLSLEEKRLRRKAKNKAKKEDSKRAREEEIRRKLYEPKNQRVRLVNKEEMSRMPGFGVASHPTFAPPMAASSDDFPCLGSAKHKPRSDGRFGGTPVETENRRPLQIQTRETSLVERTNCGEPSQPNDTSFNGIKRGSWEVPVMDLANQNVAVVPNVKPKRADPITIDLMSVLKKTTNAGEKKVPPVMTKKKALLQLSGNQLDSSNPERKKGKTRETPKPQKPSHLKAVILQDRKARQAVRAQAEMTAGVGCNVDLISPGEGRSEASAEVPSSVDATTEIESISSPEMKTEDVAEFDLVMGAQDEQSKIVASRDNVESESNVVQNISLPEEIAQNMSALKLDGCKVAPSIHSRKFRDYCDHMPSPVLDNAVSALITDIVKFQDRLYFSDPVKAHAKRRFVLGFRETKKYLCLKKLKLVIIAPDLETARSKGGIEDTVAELKEMSRSQGVLCIFSVRRDMLRRLTNKSCAVKGISCVGVINYEGSQDNYHAIQDVLPELRARYRNLVGDSFAETPAEANEVTETEENKATETEPLDVNKQVVATFLVKLTKELENK